MVHPALTQRGPLARCSITTAIDALVATSSGDPTVDAVVVIGSVPTGRAVMTDAATSLNGQSVGSPHEGGYYRFKYEVTSLAMFGSATNLLEVAVNKHAANPSVNNAERKGDFWMFGGIYRPVYIEAVPAEFIERLAIDARADLLLVHHGLFWSPSHPWTGRRYELLRLLLDHNLAVYSSHLPLDAHPRQFSP